MPTRAPQASTTTCSRTTMLYAKYSRGYKGGGWNPGECGEAYDPEHLSAYETGVKSTFWNGQARTNAAFYWYDYDDIQFTLYVPNQSFIRNAGTRDGLRSRARVPRSPRLALGRPARRVGLLGALRVRQGILPGRRGHRSGAASRTGHPHQGERADSRSRVEGESGRAIHLRRRRRRQLHGAGRGHLHLHLLQRHLQRRGSLRGKRRCSPISGSAMRA